MKIAEFGNELVQNVFKAVSLEPSFKKFLKVCINKEKVPSIDKTIHIKFVGEPNLKHNYD